MIGWRWVAKRELLLWQATVQDLRKEVDRMREERDRERLRAESAINALLAKTQGILLTPDEPKEPDFSKLQQNIYDLFGDAQEEKLRKEREDIERMQS